MFPERIKRRVASCRISRIARLAGSQLPKADKTAEVQGCRLLSNVKVAAAIIDRLDTYRHVPTSVDARPAQSPGPNLGSAIF
jgi:hypothetical protein